MSWKDMEVIAGDKKDIGTDESVGEGLTKSGHAHRRHHQKGAVDEVESQNR